MAIITKTIKSSGGDYTSASAWEAGEQGDLVTLAEIHVGECYTMTDTTALTINGSITNASYYMKLVGAAGQSYVLGSTATPVLTVSDNYTQIEGIRINGTSNSASQTGVLLSGATACQIKRCIIQKTGSGGGSNDGLSAINSGNTHYIISCLVYDWNRRGIYDGSGSGIFYVVSNCLIHNCGTGFFANASAARSICKNVAIQSATTYFGGSYNTTASKNNIAEDASSPGASGTNGAIAFVDEVADDFHIDTATDTVALDVGADLSADADFAFNYDLEGTAFSTWDRSCYSATTSGGGVITITGATAGTSVVSGTMAVARSVAGDIPALSALTGGLVATYGLIGTVPAISAVTGGLTGTFLLGGSIAGISSLTGTTGLTRAVTGAISGLSALTGTITTSTDIAISGSMAGLSTLTGTAAIDYGIIGTAVGVSTLSAVAVMRYALTGASSGLSALTGTLTGGNVIIDTSQASVVVHSLQPSMILVSPSDGAQKINAQTNSQNKVVS